MNTFRRFLYIKDEKLYLEAIRWSFGWVTKKNMKKFRYNSGVIYQGGGGVYLTLDSKQQMSPETTFNQNDFFLG